MFSLRNQTLARCSAEIFPVYTITYGETVCSRNRSTVNSVYFWKYCTRDYATKQVLRYDDFKIVVFRLRRKVRYKTPDIFLTCSSCDNSLENPPKNIFSLFKHSKNCVFWVIFQHCIRWGGGKKTALLFVRELVKRIELKLRSDCPKDFCP